ncbi:hypothetical protein OG858_46895 (plasmid) [Streptomyces europaeiscabiei]|uniref:hypothetical protein n=1 Tax=Streptomyces europaeiscabiei TaxID=146819 RepID=UPI002E8061C0|nr:hypothetical protein [Streptomyces europaeiscabiei]WUD38837.1 hypothetical protein OG858_46895 [Streptomyces europaeiscabiei]
MHEHGDDLLKPGDYLSGDDISAPAIPRIEGIPGQRQASGPGTLPPVPEQRDRRAE